MDLNNETNTWAEWRNLILSELERLSISQRKLTEALADTKNETTGDRMQLKVEVHDLINDACDKARDITDKEVAPIIIELSALRDRLTKHDILLSEIKTKVSLWAGLMGLLGGALTSIGMLLFAFQDKIFK